MSLIDEGEKAAREKLDDIRHVMPGLKNWLRFKKPQKKNMKIQDSETPRLRH
jgi:hypothetical protein